MSIACVMTQGGATLREAYDQVLRLRPAVAAGGGPRIAFVRSLIALEAATRGGEPTLDIEEVKVAKLLALKADATDADARAALAASGGDVDTAAQTLFH